MGIRSPAFSYFSLHSRPHAQACLSPCSAALWH
jgi:hypothetical protein